MNPFVVIGSGPAGAYAARTLAEAGEPVVVLTDEGARPIDRTTLSKTALAEAIDPPGLWPGEAEWLDLVEVRAGLPVVEVRVANRVVVTADGEEITYRGLLLATGAEPRRLDLDGSRGPGVHVLRRVEDAEGLRADLGPGRRLVVIGGGVIGLEVAATARGLGTEVAVVEAGPRVLGRGVPPEVAAMLADVHAAHGVELVVGVAPVRIVRDEGRVAGVELADGSLLPADAVLIGVGVTPRTDLARAAGLAVDDGIVVDAAGRTSAPDIWAAGDCVSMEGRRSESWTVAGRHGEVVARAMLGEDTAYGEVPWMWSDQYDLTLQSAGTAGPTDEPVVLRGPNWVLVLTFDADGRLTSACGVAPGGAIARPVRAALQVIGAGALVDPAVLADVTDLRALARDLLAAARAV